MDIKSSYQAYLLRIWREDELSPWRASTKEVQSGNQQHFANLSELFEFLISQTEEKNLDTNFRSA